MKQHIRNVHKKEFNYKCAEENCTYGSDSKQAFDTHMVRHHGKKPRKTFKCKKWKKIFQGANFLRNHYWRGMCIVLKTYDCNQCTVTRSFKTAEGRERHRQVFHSEDIPKLKCAICVKNYDAKSTMINHQNWCKALNVLARAK